MFEPIWNRVLRRPRADHHGRGHRHRRPGRLLRRHRRGPRRDPEPPAPAAGADRDGGAGRPSTPTSLRAEKEKVPRRRAAAGGPGRAHRARPVRGRLAGRREGASATCEEDGIDPELHDRDLRRDQAGDRQPPLGGRAVLPAHRQAAGPPGHRDRGGLPARPAPAVRRTPPPRSSGQNALVIRVQPDEGITVRFGSKVPGTSMEVRDVNMDFAYGESFTESSPEAYERLILDVLLGDPPLFPRHEEVELSWKILDPIEEFWAEARQARAVPVGHLGPGGGRRDAGTRRTELAAAMKIDLDRHHGQQDRQGAGRRAAARIGTPAVGHGADPGHRHRRGATQYDALQGGRARPSREHPSRILVVINGSRAPRDRTTRGSTPRSGSAQTRAPARRSCCGCTASSPTTPTRWCCRCCCRTPRSSSGGRWTRRTNPAKDPLGALAQRRITDAVRRRATRSARSTARADAYAPGDTDLAWTRLTPWRSLLAAALDQARCEVTSGAVEGEAGQPERRAARALAGGPAERAGRARRHRRSRASPPSGWAPTDGEIVIDRPDGPLATLSLPGPARPHGGAEARATVRADRRGAAAARPGRDVRRRPAGRGHQGDPLSCLTLPS